MYLYIQITTIILYIVATTLPVAHGSPVLRSRPVVGILSQPYHGNNDYIAASYVKWLESAGARSIVIPYEADDNLLEEVFTQINGVLFPGGESDLPPHAHKIWNLISVRNANDGDFFPVWGTCLGFEFLVMLAGGKDVLQTGFDAENISLPLIFPTMEDVAKSGGIYSMDSKLYPISRSMRETLTMANITMNNHIKGITPSQFMASTNLTQLFHITSTNFDRNGRPFVSTIESRNYPIYGTQYHPEKNNFEFGLRHGLSPFTKYYSDEPYEAINHSEEAVELSMQLAFFFVGQVRRSTHGKYHLLKRHPVVYQYPMEIGRGFEQVFLIPKAESWNERQNNYEYHDHQQLINSVVSLTLVCVMVFFVILRHLNLGLRHSVHKHYFYIPENPVSLEMLVE